MFSGFTYERMVHYRDHIHNPHINYIRLNNCKYCKQDKRDFYGSQYRNQIFYITQEQIQI